MVDPICHVDICSKHSLGSQKNIFCHVGSKFLHFRTVLQINFVSFDP